MMTATEQQLQRRKDDLLSAAISAARQLENVRRAISALWPEELRAQGLPTVNFHDLLDASGETGTAAASLKKVQAVAEKLGATR